MTCKLYVGNLPFSFTEPKLQELFEQFGQVVEVALPVDMDTGRKRGYGFVKMIDEDIAQEAIKGLNGQSVDGRQIVVNVARKKPFTGGRK